MEINMKKVKWLLIRKTISLVIGLIILWLIPVVLIMLGRISPVYQAIKFIIAAPLIYATVIHILAYMVATTYFERRVIYDGIVSENFENFEKVYRNVYQTSNVLVMTHSTKCTFALYKSWIIECKEIDHVLKRKHYPSLMFRTADRTYIMKFKSVNKRQEFMEKLSDVLDRRQLNFGPQNQTYIYNYDNHIKNKFEVMIMGVLQIALSVLLFWVLVFQVPTLLGIIKQPPKSVESTKTAKQAGQKQIEYYFKDVYFCEAGTVMARTDVDDEGRSYVKIMNSTNNMFKGIVELKLGDTIETITTDWIRPYGSGYYTLISSEKMTGYTFVEVHYKVLKESSELPISISESSLSKDPSYALIFDNPSDLNVVNVKTISSEQALYTELEKATKNTLFFHDISKFKFANISKTEKFNTVRFIAEIDTISKTVIIYEVNEQNRIEIDSFYYK